MAKKAPGGTIAQHKRAKFDYDIKETYEAGIMLLGSEVKSLRLGQVSINEAYAAEKDGELYLLNATISVYKPATGRNHEPTRPRKLLVHRKQLSKILGSIRRDGLTLVAMRLYFNARGLAKMELGLGRGKTKYDKRETEKQKDWTRSKAKLLRKDEG